TPATRRGGRTATTGIERIATQARQAPQTRYTALMHHCTVDNLRACFAALDGSKAPGVDGVKPRRAPAFGPARHWRFAGGAFTPPLTKGMLTPPWNPSIRFPALTGGA